MHRKQHILEQWGHSLASRSFSIQMKHLKTSAKLWKKRQVRFEVKGNLIIYLLQGGMIFQTIPEWALKSQGDMRKRQKPMKSWPEKFQRNFCSTTLVCLHFLPSIIKSYISKTLVIPSKRKKWGQKSKRKKSRLLCHFQNWSQSQNFGFCTCPTYRSSH